MRLFDTHCHLQDPAFAGDESAVIERAAAAGVEGMLVCGYDLHSSRAARELAATSPLVVAAVGVHPHDAASADLATLDEIARQAGGPDVAAVGEIGLDFYRELSPRGAQLAALEAQLAIAVACGKPVSVHSRGAEDVILAPLQAFACRSGPARGRHVGVMHCFGGTLEQALAFVEAGFAVSLSCAVTYPGNHEGRRLAAGLPLEAIVVETDSPYLPPQGRRGQRNEPANVRFAVEAVAEARSADPVAIAETSALTARRLFAASVSATGAR
ncbi:MAG: TatD family hydrolase [Dehalococcoidia bacterium]|nr:TatD family hydrolase [Dehalococcoidia bacterium]